MIYTSYLLEVPLVLSTLDVAGLNMQFSAQQTHYNETVKGNSATVTASIASNVVAQVTTPAGVHYNFTNTFSQDFTVPNTVILSVSVPTDLPTVPAGVYVLGLQSTPAAPSASVCCRSFMATELNS